MSRKIFSFVSLLVVLGMVLSACAPTAVTEAPVVTTEEPAAPAATDAPAAAPTEAPVATTRTGGWLDEIVFTSIDEVPNAVAQLQADQLDLYAYLADDPDTFEVVKNDPGLAYSLSYGSWDSILFNDAEFNNGKLNPFSNPKVREAANWLIDREYLSQEALGGLGGPRYVTILSAFPDYARYADLVRPIESQYAYNLEKADEIISAEMEAMGAVKNADGKWTYKDEPVVIIGLIRSEDEREIIGNYFCDQLEKIGFTCDRQVRTRTELAPIWQQGVVENGEFHFYTAGNYWPNLLRDEGQVFLQNYCPDVAGTTTEAAFTCVDELHIASQALYTNNFKNMDERLELFKTAFPLSMENSSYLPVVNLISFFPRKADLIVASDLSAGVGGSTLWPYTIRWAGKEGGTVRSANSGILTGPWNPAAGHNWNQEMNLIYATQDLGAFADPYTGLYWPQRLDKATVKVVEGTPITSTLDWVTLETAPEIKVPDDAWVDWNGESQTFVTAAEKFPDGLTAKSVTTVTYPADLWDKVKYHDGSPISMADFVLFMIMQWDTCDPKSPIYDETNIPNCDTFKSHFKAVKIISTDPLVIESYDDTVALDAEVQVGQISGNQPGFSLNWFPTAYTGPVAWHTYAPAFLAESNNEIAFSTNKSTALGVDWTNMIAGPSLEIMKKHLDQAQSDSFIPYEPTLGQYVTEDDIKARYDNLQKWYADHNHFWLGTGVYYIDEVNPVEGSVVAKRFEDFPDLSDKWSRFGEPQIAVVDVTGPAEASQSAESTFDAYVSFNDAPYPQDAIEKVACLLYDAEGNLVSTKEAAFVAEGQYSVTLTAEDLGKLPVGSAKVEFVVSSKLVAIPTFSSLEFVVSP
ncbi:MAG: ABC transporter substrate-binding protein [Chloroflexi bacterium]|nr:ABC transporter substrate-binding protein [Chloroflexota bacterium]